MNKNSHAYYDWIEVQLYTAVLADVMDDMGCRHQIMRPSIRPLYSDARIVGRAATLHAVAVDSMPVEPYKLELELLDDLQPGEVVLCAMDGMDKASIWGELLSTCARARGSRGVIIDGCTRDVASIIQMRFPLFATGTMVADSKGRCDVISVRQPVRMGDATVVNGDLVMADADGCVVVPRRIEDEVVARAMEKISGENTVREALLQGASIRSVFKEYGIL